ncbi:MAG TPA: L,D-transpeptidase family protein, partial [Lachnospiraceae bacterium]|nr:L,D-transpeptidase family protein [Lachnospiraceae bacterium]
MKEVITTIGRQRLRLIILALLLFSFVGFTHLQSTEAASSSPYLIKVNKQQNCVTIYEKDSEGKYTVPVKAMICSTGTETPLGTFKTPTKYRWKVLLEDVWGQYSTRITRDILFHSVWYYKQDPSTLSALQYNKLGTMCSHGCIRLTVADAKWIYDNCPIGTTVTIYNSKDPGPLGKPKAIKLAPGTGWDPTDVTNKNNPFNSKNPKINGAKDVTVNFGSKVNLLKGITATNTTGYYITDRIEVNGSVDTKTPGTYRIKYTVTDEIGKTARKTITYTVREDASEPVLLGVADKVVNGNTEVN